ncbi:MAG: hypothetical protein MJ248_00040 [Bacilli bacterium]|nr:hypothetical protein [Bacilli bacterium]
MNKTFTKNLLLATLIGLTLSGCGKNTSTNSGTDTNTTTTNEGTDTNTGSSTEEEFVARPVEKSEIYGMFDAMFQTRTFHQKVYGDYDIFDFIYHEDKYISQSGGDINYSAVSLPSFKANEDFNRLYYARYTTGEDGHRNYYLGEAIYLYDYVTMQIAGPDTSLEEYNPVAFYDEYNVTGNELALDTKKENTYVMRFNSRWKDNPAYDAFYYFVGGLIEAGPMLGAGRLKKIEISVSTENVMKIVGYINDLETDVVFPYYESDFIDIGTASDADLEAFLASDAVKISNEAPTVDNFANIFEDHISTDTKVYEVINGHKNFIGENHLDYDSEHAHIYGLEGNSHYTNRNGALYQDFIDGGNEVYHSPTQFPYSVINGLKNNVDVNDFRKVGENKYRYYGINFEEVFGDLSETSVPGGWAMANLYVELKNGLVDKYILETSVEKAVINGTGEVVDAYYVFETSVVTPRTVDILVPYERNEEQCLQLERALDVLNSGDVEFKVHGEEHSDDPDSDNPSVRDVVYASDYIYEEYKHYKMHMNADSTYQTEEVFDRTGYFLNKDADGTPTGVTEFKFNRKGNLVAAKPTNNDKKSLDSYWYYAEPAAEIFDYNPTTRTYTTKPYTGYYAAILIKKAFQSSADNFMDEVRITLNETLDRVETIEYDMVWRFSDGWSTSATGRLDFTYDIDTETLRTALKAMGPYQVPSMWTDSAMGFELEREFNDYFEGAKDRHGEQLVIDNVPYLYDERGDSGWAAVQFTSANNGAGEIWMVNDNGCNNPNYMQDLIQLFRDDPDYEEIGSYHNLGDVSFKNGDMVVSLFPRTNDGVWFTNLNRTPRW